MNPAPGRGQATKPMALILEPAKDLAEQVPALPPSLLCPLSLTSAPPPFPAPQVYDSIVSFSRYITDPPISSCLLIGGDNVQKQKVPPDPLLPS
jgi:hypothetical protein